jgi:hypothetical protein
MSAKESRTRREDSATLVSPPEALERMRLPAPATLGRVVPAERREDGLHRRRRRLGGAAGLAMGGKVIFTRHCIFHW